MQVVTKFHQVLDVKHTGKVQVQQLKKLRLSSWQRLTGEHLHTTDRHSSTYSTAYLVI